MTNLETEPIITFTSQPGQSYQLEALSDPLAGWFIVGGVILANLETSTLVDQSQRDGRYRLYRVRAISGN